jgi:adenosylcobinamide-phosphate synthase
MAGALGLRLGGLNSYDGTPRECPVLGAEFRKPGKGDIRFARYITVAASLGAAIAAALARAALRG